MTKKDGFIAYSKNAKKINYLNKSNFDPNQYANGVDAFLIKIWTGEGLNGYENGFFWLTDPSKILIYQSRLKPFLGENMVVGRTAFGDLFVVSKKNKISVFNVRINDIILYEEDLTFFFNVLLLNEDFLNKMLDKVLFDEGVAKLGEIDSDECLGFFPPILLGGDFISESLQKVKLLEHLKLLQQL
ncbi:T6SS immunity protein Tdi1 domain-containing protein [Maribacter sp. 2307UL18-2]|uniref:T6SS immunity protein Tdi1 domain-containing protein n=1 Tax=Maribacter sp. 2307UL18-2 TaxID=3386274 RepID=UPI0039BC21FA